MEESILKADIFFVVTTVAVSLVSVGSVVALVYVIRILRDVKILSTKMKVEGEKILDDMDEFREETKSGVRFAVNLIGKMIGISRKRSKAEKEDSE